MIAKLKKGIHWRRSLLVTGMVTLITVSPVYATLTDVALTSSPAASLLPGVAQQAGDLAGLSVDTDGTTIVIGVPQAGGGNNAVSQGVNKLLGLSAQPPILAPGKVYVFQRDLNNGSQWTQVATLMAAGGVTQASFGVSVAVDGDTIVVGSDFPTTKEGLAYIFEKPQQGWSNTTVSNETAVLSPAAHQAGVFSSSFFGHSVDIQGDTVVVGQWGKAGAITAASASAAYIFKRPVAGWGVLPIQAETAILQPLDPLTNLPPTQFGISVAIDGATVVVGGDLTGAGAAYVFEMPVGGWGVQPVINAPSATLVASAILNADTPRLGYDVAISGNTVVAGAFQYGITPSAANVNTTGEVLDRGAVFIYEKPVGGWSNLTPQVEDVILTAPVPVQGEGFGHSVAITSERIMVGSYAAMGSVTNPVTGIITPAAAAPVTGYSLSGTALTDVPGKTYVYTTPVGGWVAYGAQAVPTPLVPEFEWSAPNNPAVLGDYFGYAVAAAKTTYVAGGWGMDADITVPADGLIEMDVGTIAVKETTVDLTITNTLPAGTVPASGKRLTYTITVANNDPIDTANNVVVSDTLPADLMFFSATPTGACDVTALPLITCSLGNLAPNSQASIDLVVDVINNAVNIVHTASVNASESVINSATTNNVANVAPTVDAGTAQTVGEGATVTLDGSASSDTDGTIASYAWTSNDGVTLVAGATPAQASFTAPAITVNPTTLSFELTVTDNGGASSTSIVNVNVNDVTAPIITLNGNSPMTVNQGSVFNDPKAVVSDNVDADVTIMADPASTVDGNVVGVYTLTYSASDAAGNGPTTVTRTVNVVDGTAPMITLNNSGPITLKQGQAFVDPQAVVSDNVDASREIVSPDSPNVDTATIGSYTVSYNANDNAGHAAATQTLTVNVVDGIVPTIALNGANTITIPVGGTFSDPKAVVSDNVDTDKTISGAGNVDTATAGSYTLTYSAVDVGGNVAADVSRTVVVNALPVVNGLPTATVTAGVAYSYTLNATDAEGDALTYSLSNAPNWLTLSAFGVLSGSPAEADVGSHENITISVSDGHGTVMVGPFSVEVTAAAAVGGTGGATSGSGGGTGGATTGTGGGGGGGGSLPLSLLAALLGLGLRRRSNK